MSSHLAHKYISNLFLLRQQLTCFYHVVQRGEPLLHGGGDGPQDQDEGEVHPPHQRSSQHPRILIEARNVAGNGMEEFIRPGYCQELLPPSGGHIGDVETKNEGQGNHVEEGIKVYYDTLE